MCLGSVTGADRTRLPLRSRGQGTSRTTGLSRSHECGLFYEVALLAVHVLEMLCEPRRTVPVLYYIVCQFPRAKDQTDPPVSTRKVDAHIVRRLSAKLVSLATRKRSQAVQKKNRCTSSTQSLAKIFVNQLDHLLCSGSNAVMI